MLLCKNDKRGDSVPPLTEARKRAKANYNNKILKKVLLEFYPSDEDLVKKLEEQPNKQGYIKDLIRKDLNK